jgi:hypothetical protein
MHEFVRAARSPLARRETLPEERRTTNPVTDVLDDLGSYAFNHRRRRNVPNYLAVRAQRVMKHDDPREPRVDHIAIDDDRALRSVHNEGQGRIGTPLGKRTVVEPHVISAHER